MSNSTTLVIEALQQAAVSLEKQDKQSAINSLSKITGEVASFKQAAAASEKETKQLQIKTTAEVSDLIAQQGRAYAERNNVKKELEVAYANVAGLKAAIPSYTNQIAHLQSTLGERNNRLQQLRNRQKELNDTSFWSIIMSIGTLGFDRLVKLISLEIDDVQGQINNIHNTMAAVQQELSKSRNLQGECERRVDELNRTIQQKNKVIDDLSFLELKLNNQEKVQRQRLVYFTEVNLFYIKLQTILNNLSNKVEDVRDIVEELNNQNPTIASFDPAQTGLISLKQAILLFGDTLKNDVSIREIEPVFDPNAVYFITNEWLGNDKFLTIDKKDAAQNKLMMTGSEGKGQLWVIKSVGDGFFRLMNRTYLDQKSLDIIDEKPPVDFFPKRSKPWDKPGFPPPFIADDQIQRPSTFNPNPTVALTGNNNGKGQLWKIEPEFGYFRLTSAVGNHRSLDVVNEGGNMKLRLNDSSTRASSQQWKFTKYN
ncbi:MAG: hypothetical protein ABIN91_06655 [Mucilaginibacter sp.]|uniref:coiled-coil domain-containing protein n=1 Tax=Mucilaginibacter sp. TaxID=1882438 RepID=UPI003267B16F